jgi:hypothetical protein
VNKAPQAILDLVERFERNISSYRATGYNEAQLRTEFIDPMFEALGWDMANRAGHAEAYKDVIHEDAIKVGGVTKAPDYCFRIGGVRKFFLEAKRPSVGIVYDGDAAYQLRRYAWSSKLPLSILTDFDEFAVYDCRIRPNRGDKASEARICYMKFSDYADRWAEIADVFSKEAVLRGSFDKFAEATRGKRGTSEVDAEFLKEIEKWREKLARNFSLRNESISVPQLNSAVQATIDRIIFLRMCEDRGIETYGQLEALRNGERTYRRLVEIFYRADERYNSGLFYFNPERGRQSQPDQLTPDLNLDDEVLKEIIAGLYYPRSPYEFGVLPPEIVGNVYEQFLGKVIRLTAGHNARVEEKPEVRKAGGVYYTPQYIVDYIVHNTVGKLCEGKSPKAVEKLRILDPACGSGSFLLGAYKFLMDYHRDWYTKDGPQKDRNEMYQGRGGQWFLTTAEKKRILLNNIYGVDIDPQAVEVTKLSLLLKVLEDESSETLAHTLRARHQRALPDLDGNIKCGNSLIGPDFYEGKDPNSFSEDERRRIKAFDWREEFRAISNSGGFDAVVGNPPYVRVRVFGELYPEESEYMEQKYRCAQHVWDIYLLFYERAVHLCRRGGLAGFIVPIQTLHQPNCESLRKLLVSETSIMSLADLSRIRVFEEAIVKNCILVCKKGRTPKTTVSLLEPETPHQLSSSPPRKWPQSAISRNPGYSMKLDLLSGKKALCDKLIRRSQLLADICYVTFGLRSCAKGVGKGDKRRLITANKDARRAKPYLEGRDIQRYAMRPTGRYIRYIPAEMYSPRRPELFETEKIVSQSMLSKMRLVATLDKEGFYVEQSLVCIIPHGIITKDTASSRVPLDFILGVLNSRLETFYFATNIIDYSLGGGLVHATPGSQEKLIIPRIAEPAMSPIRSRVRRMLDLHKRSAQARAADEKMRLEREIKQTDAQIDRLLYELYGLTEKEIRIIEEANA